MIENQSDLTLGRIPGQVNGQQFVIQNCKVCELQCKWMSAQLYSAFPEMIFPIFD